MAEQQLGGPRYLDTVGRELDGGIDVCWTGPDIVSREITVAHVRELRQMLRRKPLIWDNLHANDYDGRRFYCGPYAGRAEDLRGEVAGILSNPNSELPLNYVPLRTLGAFVHGRGPWDAREAYLEAMAAWLPRFETAGSPISLDDLLLLGDCYYLPHEEGPLAEALVAAARDRLASDQSAPSDAAAFTQQAQRLRDACARMADLRDRPLFYALCRRIWELREEMDLLLACTRSEEAAPGAPCRSDFHLPGTYRGGMVARLQRLMTQREDGTFVPTSDPRRGRPGPAPGATS
jgi:protein O-GlcNAcase/histone acetyltransferase